MAVNGRRFRIGVIATASRMDPAIAEPAQALVRALYGSEVELQFHPSSFDNCGHFAGDDATRAAALLNYAEAPEIDAIWFGRGGYGSARIAFDVVPCLTAAALRKPWLGYSDAGTLLAGLYQRGAARVAHGPVVHDLFRAGGEAAATRGLRWLVERAPDTLEPGLMPGGKAMAFNLTVLCHLIGTPFEPDLAGHELLIEEVSEHMYRIDRSLCQLAQTAMFRQAKGLRLGRCSDVPHNEPDFGLSAEAVARHWCGVAGIPYLGSADIGHDADNKIVPFGRWAG
jgi:muramoyltetrapeptide carboxypeptidase